MELLTGRQKFVTEGYNVGNIPGIYNPWSILQVLVEPDRELEDFWNNTGGVKLVDELVRYARLEFHDTLQGLLRGEFVETKVSKDLVFPQLKRNTAAIWSLLLHAGYIKPMPVQMKAIGSTEMSRTM